jgi:hypothetical protein
MEQTGLPRRSSQVREVNHSLPARYTPDRVTWGLAGKHAPVFRNCSFTVSAAPPRLRVLQQARPERARREMLRLARAARSI